MVAYTRFFLEGFETSELPILAEDQDDQVIQALGLFGPLPLNNPGTSPRSLGDVVCILLLLRAAKATEMRWVQNGRQIRDNLPEEGEWLRDFEAAQRSSAVSQETFGNRGHVSGEDAWIGDIRWT